MNEQAQGQVPGVKRCTKCGIEKLLTEFPKDRSTRDGLKYWCRSCANAHDNARRKRYYDANRQAILAQKKTYHKANREAILSKLKAYYEANKEALVAKKKIYEKANRKTILIQRKARYQANREALLAEKKIYWKANKEKISAKLKAYYKVNKEMILVKRKDYRQANREVQQFRIKVWRKKNPERNREIARESKRRRRARLFKAVTVPLTAAMEAAKYADQRGLCYYRNEELNGIYHIEHKIPFCRGGNDIPENIVLACGRCNREKGRMTDVEFFELIRAESVEKVA